MRHIFIINPVAGDGKYQDDIVNSIHARIKKLNMKFTSPGTRVI